MDPEAVIRTTLNIREGDNLPFYSDRRRNVLAGLFQALGYRKGAEIGVERGRFTEILCLANPDLHMLCVDPWGAYSDRLGTITSKQSTRAYRHAMARLPKYNTTVMRLPSVVAAKEVPDASLDFVYIDALHDFDSVISDILAWVPKVREGGIVSGHDYFPATGFGVVEAVDAYTRAHNIHSWYITGDWPPSWLWVK